MVVVVVIIVIAVGEVLVRGGGCARQAIGMGGLEGNRSDDCALLASSTFSTFSSSSSSGGGGGGGVWGEARRGSKPTARLSTSPKVRFRGDTTEFESVDGGTTFKLLLHIVFVAVLVVVFVVAFRLVLELVMCGTVL